MICLEILDDSIMRCEQSGSGEHTDFSLLPESSHHEHMLITLNRLRKCIYEVLLRILGGS